MAIAALVLPLIAGASLFVIDHMTVTQKTASLQKAADAAAIATAKEMHFIKTSGTGGGNTLNAIAESYAQRNMPGAAITARATAKEDTLVTVDLAMTLNSPLGQLFEGEKTLTASATAEIYSGQNICVIAADLAEREPGLSLGDQAEIRAGECGIYSNSTREFSVKVSGGGHIEANFICSAGGYTGSDSSFSTPVTTDCLQIKDPLEDRVFPPAPACDPAMPNHIGHGESVNLAPGTYCGGLTIDGDASVWLAPGLYFFEGGPLIIKNEATVSGDNVGLFFEDQKSYFDLSDSAEISFSAPETGAMAGILVSARSPCPSVDRCNSYRTFSITSAKVRSLLGTIYLPLDDLMIDTTMPISEEAAFTILIVDNLKMKQSPVLILNTDYAKTNVPVPLGLSGTISTRIVE